jgi:prepilin-type processing-associated H-X9-DG protein
VLLDPETPVCGQSLSAVNPPAKFQFVYEEFFSDHPGGVQTLRCDGSVRFMKDDTDRNVYFALCTRDGGEIIDDAQ